MASMRKAAIRGGFGAGVGAALGMMLVMAVLRFTTNTTSIPELMEDSLVRLTGGQINSFFINNLGVGGKALLLVSIAEGTLLLGGLLGLAFTHLWLKLVSFSLPRYMSGLAFGLLLGLLLNAVFLPIVGQGFFGSTALEVTAPPDVALSLYGDSLAPYGVPMWINMFLLAAVFGLALAYLLPWPATAKAAEGAVAIADRPMDRRGFNKAIGGTLLALFGGGVLWVGIRQALAPPSVAGVQEVDITELARQSAATRVAELGGTPTRPAPTSTAVPPTATTEPEPGKALGGEDATPTQAPENSPTQPAPAQETPTQAPAETPSAVADANHDLVDRPTPQPTNMPENAGVQPGFEGVKAVLVPATTPTESFYITTKNFIDPTVDGNSWKLTFGGMVDNPYTITLKDLKAMPSFERTETLACISNPVGGDLIGNAVWKGVDFAALLKKAKPQKGVVDVICRAEDGYGDSFPISVALNNECMLVYEMNGQPLTNKHGFPARLLVPNIYGMKNVKWINAVELVNFDFKGYWEGQGWDDVAEYNTLTRIDYPNKGRIDAKPLYIGGVAFAGNRGVQKVEVTTDGGKSWNEAQILVVPSKFSWVLWTYAWNPQPGSYTLQARATDGKGNVQTSKKADTYPDGATGYHTRVVRVG
ncbi:MAG TPA: molybdopterin-dependent oxidoreductase [Chloroflexia bacterium]